MLSRVCRDGYGTKLSRVCYFVLGRSRAPSKNIFSVIPRSTARGNPFSPDITDRHVAPLLAMTSPIGVRNGFLRSLRSVEMTEGTERCGHRSLRGCDCERRWQMPLAKRSLCLSPAFLFRPRWRSATFPKGEGLFLSVHPNGNIRGSGGQFLHPRLCGNFDFRHRIPQPLALVIAHGVVGQQLIILQILQTL